MERRTGLTIAAELVRRHRLVVGAAVASFFVMVACAKSPYERLHSCLKSGVDCDDALILCRDASSDELRRSLCQDAALHFSQTGDARRAMEAYDDLCSASSSCSDSCRDEVRFGASLSDHQAAGQLLGRLCERGVEPACNTFGEALLRATSEHFNELYRDGVAAHADSSAAAQVTAMARAGVRSDLELALNLLEHGCSAEEVCAIEARNPLSRRARGGSCELLARLYGDLTPYKGLVDPDRAKADGYQQRTRRATGAFESWTAMQRDVVPPTSSNGSNAGDDDDDSPAPSRSAPTGGSSPRHGFGTSFGATRDLGCAAAKANASQLVGCDDFLPTGTCDCQAQGPQGPYICHAEITCSASNSASASDTSGGASKSSRRSTGAHDGADNVPPSGAIAGRCPREPLDAERLGACKFCLEECRVDQDVRICTCVNYGPFQARHSPGESSNEWSQEESRAKRMCGDADADAGYFNSCVSKCRPRCSNAQVLH